MSVPNTVAAKMTGWKEKLNLNELVGDTTRFAVAFADMNSKR